METLVWMWGVPIGLPQRLIPTLQVPGQVVRFLTNIWVPDPVSGDPGAHRLSLGKAVAEFAAGNGISVIRFGEGQRKLEVMRPYRDQLARGDGLGWRRSGWVIEG